MQKGNKSSNNAELIFLYNQIIASSVSNMIGIVSHHPLDTIKVRM